MCECPPPVIVATLPRSRWWCSGQWSPRNHLLWGQSSVASRWPRAPPSHDLPLVAPLHRSQTRVVTISIIGNPTIQIYELAATPTVMCDGDGDYRNAPNSIISEYYKLFYHIQFRDLQPATW